MQQFYRCVLCFIQGLKCNMQAIYGQVILSSFIMVFPDLHEEGNRVECVACLNAHV